MNTNISKQPERNQVTVRPAAPPPPRRAAAPSTGPQPETFVPSAPKPAAKSSKQSGLARLSMAAVAFAVTVGGCVGVKQLGTSAAMLPSTVAQTQMQTNSSTTASTQIQTVAQSSVTQPLATTRSSS